MSSIGSLGPDLASRGRWSKALALFLILGSVLLILGIARRSRSGANGELLRQEATKAAQQGRWLEADAALGRLADPTPSDWLLKAVVATSLEQPETAAGYLAKVPRGGPLAARVALVSGRVELGRFRARPMEDALRLALELDPKLAEARRSLVYLYGLQGRRRELLEQFAALADQGPLTFSLVHHWCIAHQEQIKEPDDLKVPLEKFVANDPEDRWSRLGLARVYRRLGLFDRSRECLAPLPESDADARAARAEVEFDRGDLEAVTTLLADGPAEHPRLARLRGQMALNRHDGPSAVRSFRLSDAAEPNHSETLYGLAQALRIVDERAEADRYARRAGAQRAFRDHMNNLANTTSNQDSKAAFCCRLASECEAAGYLPEARAWYKLAIADDPLHIQAQEAFSRLSATIKATDAAGRPADAPGLSRTN